MLETMGAVDTVESLRRQILTDLVRVPLLQVKRLSVRHDGVRTATDIEDGS